MCRQPWHVLKLKNKIKKVLGNLMLVSESFLRKLMYQTLMENWRGQLLEGAGGKWGQYQRICGGEKAELHLLGHFIKWLETLGQDEKNIQVKRNVMGWVKDLQGYLDEDLEGWSRGNSRLKEIVAMMSEEDGQCKIRGGVARQLHIVLSNIVQFSPMFLRSEGKNWNEVNAAIKKISIDRAAKGDEAVIYVRLGSRQLIVDRDQILGSNEKKEVNQENRETADQVKDQKSVNNNDDSSPRAVDRIWKKDDDIYTVYRAITDRRFQKRSEILTKARPYYEAIIKKGQNGEYDNLSVSDKQHLNRIIGTYFKLATGAGNQDIMKPNWSVKK